MSRIKKSPVGQTIDEYVHRAPKPVLVAPKNVSFKTKRQLTYYQAIMTNKIAISSGSAGTGKTFVAVYAACCALANNDVERIIITKPAVEIGKSLGALPGGVDEKMAVYIRSIEDCFIKLIGKPALDKLYQMDKLEILPLNYIRGLTFDKAFVIADEMQNADYTQTKALLTRFGEEAKFVLNGDIDQDDLKGQSGLPIFIDILSDVDDIEHVEFTIDDIVRDGIVKDILIACSKYEKSKRNV